jgi:hypothetical protein
MTLADQLHGIVDRYVEAGEPWPASARQIAGWAISQGLWKPHPTSIVDQCADQLARAMREEYIVDPQGRTVRAKHAAKVLSAGQQMTLWADIRTAGKAHMEIAFQQRRQQVLGDCRQLKTDVDSYNENADLSEPIQMVLDFSRDLEEEALAGRR